VLLNITEPMATSAKLERLRARKLTIRQPHKFSPLQTYTKFQSVREGPRKSLPTIHKLLGSTNNLHKTSN